VIRVHGVATDPAKIQAIRDWPTPSSVKHIRSFLGLAGYYRRFIRQYGVLSRPPSDLLKKNAQFQWTSIHQQTFEALKQALISAPVLALPDFSKSCTVETDASDKGVGAVLMQ
jgi:trans-aconitate methyltransferase